MSYHRYVLHAPPTYMKEYQIFPANQCVFIVHNDEAPAFRGSFSVPTLAGTQDSNFISPESVQKVYGSIPDTVTGKVEFNSVRDLFQSFKQNLSLVGEIRHAIENSGDIFETTKNILARRLTGTMTTRKDAFPYALDENIRFAGVSIQNSSFPLPSESLVEVPAMVRGVATIFPRPTDDIPVCEKYVPGDIFSETIPVYKRQENAKIPIGRILDFPNPHSMRVAINIANQPPEPE